MSDVTTPATVSASCIPTYIVLRRVEGGTYTTYTFSSAKDVSKWAIDEISSSVPTSRPGPSLVSEIVAEQQTPISKFIARTLNGHELTDFFESEAELLLCSEFLQNIDTMSDASVLPALTESQSELLATYITSAPDIYVEKLFIATDKQKKAVLYNIPIFVQACYKKKYKLAGRLLKGNINNSVIRVFQGLDTFLREGKYQICWDKHWDKNVTFNGVGSWKKENVDAILQDCMRSWLRDEKPSDSIREFFLKAYIVKNFVIYNSPNVTFLDRDRDIGSSEFLASYMSTMTNKWTGGLPAEFASWISKGTTFVHCKAALTSLGVKQIRRSSGQVYQDILFKPYNYDPSMKGHQSELTSMSFHEPCDGSLPFNKEDISLSGGDLCEYEKGPAETDGDNALFTENFREMIAGLEPGKSPLDIYRSLRDDLAKIDELDKTLPPTPKYKTFNEWLKATDPDNQLALKESFWVKHLHTEIENRQGDYYPNADINKAATKAKESDTPSVQIVWTPDEETRITHVT